MTIKIAEQISVPNILRDIETDEKITLISKTVGKWHYTAEVSKNMHGRFVVKTTLHQPYEKPQDQGTLYLNGMEILAHKPYANFDYIGTWNLTWYTAKKLNGQQEYGKMLDDFYKENPFMIPFCVVKHKLPKEEAHTYYFLSRSGLICMLDTYTALRVVSALSIEKVLVWDDHLKISFEKVCQISRIT